MGKLKSIFLIVSILFLNVEANGFFNFQQFCSPEEELKAGRLLAVANIYENAAELDKATERYEALILSPCDNYSSEGQLGLERVASKQNSLWQQLLDRLEKLSLTTVVLLISFILITIAILLLAKGLLWGFDHQDSWVVLPFMDLTGNQLGDGVAESITNKIHEIRFLFTTDQNSFLGMTNDTDLPSFSVASKREGLLSALTQLDSLDVSGIGLPFGSAISSLIRWLDLGGSRLLGTIRQVDKTVEINARLEVGRKGECKFIWTASKTLDTEEQNVKDVIYLLQEDITYQIFIDILEQDWGTNSASAFQSCTEGLKSAHIYYRSNSRDKQALQKAKVTLKKAYSIDPTFTLAAFNLALMELNSGNYDETIRLLKELSITAEEELEFPIAYNLGVAYYQKLTDWSYGMAETMFQKVIDGLEDDELK